MKQLLAAVGLAIALASPALAYSGYSNDLYVNGYTKQDGTYVNGYRRTMPDNNPYNNYGSAGNYNPNRLNQSGYGSYGQGYGQGVGGYGGYPQRRNGW